MTKDPKFLSRLGKCYVLSGRHVLSNLDCNLVHGTIRRSGTVKELEHAWVEKGDSVIDPVLDKEMSKEMYYAIMNAKPDKIYSSEEMMKRMVKAKHWGKWD